MFLVVRHVDDVGDVDHLVDSSSSIVVDVCAFLEDCPDVVVLLALLDFLLQPLIRDFYGVVNHCLCLDLVLGCCYANGCWLLGERPLERWQ